MCNKEQLEECVYSKVREIKQKFYDCKSLDDWQSIKEELVGVLGVAETMMDSTFYAKYKEGVIASVKKMYDAKQTWFSKQKNGTGGEKKTYQPKVTYLLQDELATALTKYIELQTKLLTIQYNNVFNAQEV